ncbi:MAG: hypothetical protein QNJ74_01180 [Trichodesmium sp. MO_231.B1]|nr:hypothetical protein [Trichodesmium sp. MO_231.B1]
MEVRSQELGSSVCVMVDYDGRYNPFVSYEIEDLDLVNQMLLGYDKWEVLTWGW